jgi:hypothetical protein
MTSASPILLSIIMLAVFALVWGGIAMIRRGVTDRKRGVLMIVAALVLLGNVLIATRPG